MMAVNAAVLLPLFSREFWRRGGPRVDYAAREGGVEERARRPRSASSGVNWSARWVWMLSVIWGSKSRTVGRDLGHGVGQTNRVQLEDLEQGASPRMESLTREQGQDAQTPEPPTRVDRASTEKLQGDVQGDYGNFEHQNKIGAVVSCQQVEVPELDHRSC